MHKTAVTAPVLAAAKRIRELGHLSEFQLHLVLRQTSRRLKLKVAVTPGAFRHTLATEAIERGAGGGERFPRPPEPADHEALLLDSLGGAEDPDARLNKTRDGRVGPRPLDWGPYQNSVRQLRVRRRLTQGELAELAGTKQPNIARLESGRAGPTLGFLEKVASALGAKLDVRLRG